MLNLIGKVIDKEESFHIVNTDDNGVTFFIKHGGKKVLIVNTELPRRVLFSIPGKTSYDDWFSVKVDKIQYPNIVRLYWAPLKPSLQVKGYFNNDGFVVTHIKLNSVIPYG